MSCNCGRMRCGGTIWPAHNVVRPPPGVPGHQSEADPVWRRRAERYCLSTRVLLTWHGCDGSGYVYTHTVATEGSDSRGFDSGVGFTIKSLESNWRFVSETRCHSAITGRSPPHSCHHDGTTAQPARTLVRL